jgi:hypothetical protein
MKICSTLVLLASVAVYAPVFAADKAIPPLKLTGTVPLPQLTGGSNHLAVDVKRRRFFVTAPGERKVIVVDLKANKIVRVLDNTPAAAAVFLPDLDLLCVSGGGGVTFFTGDSLDPAGALKLNRAVDEVQYDTKAQLLFVGLMDAAKPGIAVVDAKAKTLLGELRLPAKPQGFVLEVGGSRIYANTPGKDQVTVLDREKKAVVGEWKLADAKSNYPIALDQAGHRLFVACRRPARVLVLDTSNGKAIASTGSGGDADDMSFDPEGHRIYVACGDGKITAVQQVDPDSYRKLEDVPTRDGARNSLFAPELKTLFVVLPHDGGDVAELRAYTRE